MMTTIYLNGSVPVQKTASLGRERRLVLTRALIYLNGSVQKTASLERERRLVLTARLSSIGSSGGTTLVRIRVHSRNSL